MTNENDNDPSFTSDASVSVAENETLAYTAVATDADGDSLRYSLSGADAARFTATRLREVSFIEAPDFENPDDAGGNNVYDITVTASDDTNETTHDVAITVTNVNDNMPSFTSPDSANVAENQTLAYTAVATDADGDDLTPVRDGCGPVHDRSGYRSASGRRPTSRTRATSAEIMSMRSPSRRPTTTVVRTTMSPSR